MTEFNIRKIDSKLLFLVKSLIGDYKESQEKDSSTHRGEKFFSFIGFGHTDSLWKKMPDEEWSAYLTSLCVEYGIIREIYFDILDEERDTENPIKSKHYKYAGSAEFEDFFNFGISAGRDNTIFCSIDLNCEKAKSFFDEYLLNWLNDNLFKEKKNLLKAEKQIEKIIEDIYALLDQHPDRNLLVQENILHKEDIDFIAVMYFLEKMKYLEILNVDAGQFEYWIMRVNISKKFYEDFEREGWILSNIKFDFNYLKTGKKTTMNKKEDLGEIIQQNKKVQSRKTGIENEIGFYKNICTDFKEGKIWIAGKSKKSKMADSKMRKLWKLLLLNVGDVFSYDRIATGLNLTKQMGLNRLSCIENLAQTKKNLIERIAKLGIDRSVVSDWFIDNNGYGLKKEG
ncbi:hypothetical protein HYW83_05510 [Candidatus Peregrinibacteria bacterium]|nr:hypothetical protein [Candidatus Peregrinibacteria bacterium]